MRRAEHQLLAGEGENVPRRGHPYLPIPMGERCLLRRHRNHVESHAGEQRGAAPIEDLDEYAPCMQIDAAVICVGLCLLKDPRWTAPRRRLRCVIRCFTVPHKTTRKLKKAEETDAMSEPDYDEPDVEERWCLEQLTIVADYLRSQKVQHGRIGEWPAWHVAPYASIWAIESLARPEWIGWWVICGDLPTDCISSAEMKAPKHPRKAMRVFAQNWLKVVNAWKEGREIDNTRIGDSCRTRS